ncbi:MAG: hypothetical protein ISP49_03965 [Reyranella sp.]|jgi:hypothetical protein|nr:hypothetical protein [Reyranella sp.]MBL6650724.1 hypothetical protein [Reyranella sp.]
MKKLLIAFALLSLAACSENSTWFRFNNAFGTGTFPVASEGQAAVYLVREVSYPDAPPIKVTMDGAPIVDLPPTSYARLNLAPKLYDFRTYGLQRNRELIITVAPGQTRFFVVQPSGENQQNAEMLELSQEEGRKLVRKAQQVTPFAFGTYAPN